MKQLYYGCQDISKSFDLLLGKIKKYRKNRGVWQKITGYMVTVFEDKRMVFTFEYGCIGIKTAEMNTFVGDFPAVFSCAKFY